MDDRIIKLQRALDHAGNTHTLADLVEQIHQGRAVLWERGDVLAVTELVQYPQLKAMRIWLVAGDLSGCDELLPELEIWARREGCSRIEAEGRIGWHRYGKGKSYKPVATVFRKELGP